MNDRDLNLTPTEELTQAARNHLCRRCYATEPANPGDGAAHRCSCGSTDCDPVLELGEFQRVMGRRRAVRRAGSAGGRVAS